MVAGTQTPLAFTPRPSLLLFPRSALLLVAPPSTRHVHDVEGFVAGKQDTPSTQATMKTGRSVNLPAAACHRRPGGKAPTLQDPMAYRRASFHSESGRGIKTPETSVWTRWASCCSCWDKPTVTMRTTFGTFANSTRFRRGGF
ncbi:hypothetical protein B0H16DRAFT_1896130 [Mycena metata]|uniref:Uncharacterized protein n=1 Tax=Mycena metata TaxID=1033252 RepID=A0AAD7HL92_9AGAR|nr:hypothetical protein B0H16DRAFT_1896130 [Mycena metata]